MLLLQVDSQTFLYFAVAYTGLMLGGFPILGQLLWPEYFGRAHIGSITGLVQFVTTLIGALGPLIAGVVSDQTGSYETALYVLIGTWLACGAVIFAIRPERTPPPAPSPLAERGSEPEGRRRWWLRLLLESRVTCELRRAPTLTRASDTLGGLRLSLRERRGIASDQSPG